ncbi:hypothetical protein IC575_021864 [Cucumis melo]
MQALEFGPGKPLLLVTWYGSFFHLESQKPGFHPCPMEIGGSDGAAKFIQSKEFKELNVGFMMDEGQASPEDEFRVFYADRSPWSLIIKAKGTPGHGSRMYDNSAMENLMKSVEIISRFRESQFEIVKVASANPPSPRPVAANRAQPFEPIVVTKVDTEIQGVRKVEEVSDSDGDGDVESADGGKVGRGRKLMESLSIKKIKKEELRKKILLGFRICGFAFCLVSVSVMASDKDQGWALDSFYRYKEFRYCMAVNVIGFVYSALQSYDLVCFLSTGKHMIRNHFKQYFDFFIDQASFYFGLKLGF